MKRIVSIERQENGEIKYELAKPVIKLVEGDGTRFTTQIAPVNMKELRQHLTQAEDALDAEHERHKTEVADSIAYIESLQAVITELKGV